MDGLDLVYYPYIYDFGIAVFCFLANLFKWNIQCLCELLQNGSIVSYA